MRKLLAVRYVMRTRELDDVPVDQVERVLRDADITAAQAEAIYRLTSLCGPHERYVMPEIQREETMNTASCSPEACKGGCGLGFTSTPERGN